MSENSAEILKSMITKRKRPGAEPVTNRELKHRLVPVDVLLGNGKAKVGRERRMGHGVGYGEFNISGSCYVEISCNQDEDTIRKASAACIHIATEEMERDEEEMLRVVEGVVEELNAEE